MTVENKKVGERLRMLRNDAGLGLKDIASEFGKALFNTI